MGSTVMCITIKLFDFKMITKGPMILWSFEPYLFWDGVCSLFGNYNHKSLRSKFQLCMKKSFRVDPLVD